MRLILYFLEKLNNIWENTDLLPYIHVGHIAGLSIKNTQHCKQLISFLVEKVKHFGKIVLPCRKWCRRGSSPHKFVCETAFRWSRRLLSGGHSAVAPQPQTDLPAASA